LADDLQDAPGGGVLDFSQAQRAARGWCTNQQRLASGLALPSSGPYTAARAMADYIEDYRRRGGKASDSIESVARQNILPELGNMLVVKLTTRRLLDWHRSIAERPRRWRSRPSLLGGIDAWVKAGATSSPCAAFRLDSGVLTVDGMESCDVALEMGPLKSIWTTTIMSVHQIFSRKTI
jgi:hypothetical protein